jgi:predicted nucleic-acid-binding protein
MRAVDTNVLVRLLVRDDAEQAALADEYIVSGAWVSLLVLLEALWELTVRYERSGAQLAGTLDLLLDHESLVLQEPEVVKRAVERFRRNRSAGLADLLILELASQHGHAPMATFDRDFAKHDGTVRLERARPRRPTRPA